MFAERTPNEGAGFTAEYGRDTVRGESWGGRVAYVLQTAVRKGLQSKNLYYKVATNSIGASLLYGHVTMRPEVVHLAQIKAGIQCTFMRHYYYLLLLLLRIFFVPNYIYTLNTTNKLMAIPFKIHYTIYIHGVTLSLVNRPAVYLYILISI